MQRFAVGIALLCLAAPAAAQTVKGLVLDMESGRPIEGARVALVPLSGARPLTGQTGADGRFQLRATEPGLFKLELNRVGTPPVVDGPFELKGGQTVEPTYRLKLVAFELDPLEVVAEKAAAERFLREAGFYERQSSDFGKFITREAIEARKAKRFTDLLNTIAGVRLVPSTQGFDRTSITLRGSALSAGGPCHPKVYLDGLVVVQGDARPWRREITRPVDNQATEIQAAQFERTEVDIDDVVMPNDVEAIEVYRSGSQVPAKFGGTSTSAQCGVIVIWSRRGARPRQ
ncbi:MAG: carboxypeptidase regulatory-like domain-containing protein [Gemmatimonadales bacterium]